LESVLQEMKIICITSMIYESGHKTVMGISSRDRKNEGIVVKEKWMK